MSIIDKLKNTLSILNTTKNKQYLAVFVVMITVLGVISLFIKSDDEHIINSSNFIQPTKKTVTIDMATKSLDMEEKWRAKMEVKSKEMDKKIDAKDKETEYVIEELKKVNKAALDKISNLENKLNDLEHNNANHYKDRYGHERNQVDNLEITNDSQIVQVSINLTDKTIEKSDELKTVDTIIPGGTRVRAIIVGGIDASTASHAQSEPKPVIMHLIEDGITPRDFKVEMEGCMLQGAAYAERSSQRAFIRLTEFNCVEKLTGEVVTRNIKGWVYGPDGKLGIQGKYVDLSGKLLSNSAVSGIFGGLSNVLSPQVNMFNPFSGSTSVPAPNAESRLISGITSGASKAMDELSRYYLDEAKQYHAIVEVPAGILVDVVIEKDVDVSETLFKKTISNTNDEKRREKMRTYNIENRNDNIFGQKNNKVLDAAIKDVQESVKNNSYLNGTLR